jgi:putative hydrolase of the HAD superfamily
MFAWDEVQVVMLDLDGTLLDLYFDNHFWQEHVPRRYASLHGLALEAAKAKLRPRFQRMEGTIHWYCLDYWSRELELDIIALKRELDHLIAVHPHVPEFLEAAAQAGKRIFLVTNAHTQSLALKMERTRLAHRFHLIVCAHDLGLPKEDPRFWSLLQKWEPFDPLHTLLIDDNPAVLRSARVYGIAHLLSIWQPDSRRPPRACGEFPALRSFLDIMPK